MKILFDFFLSNKIHSTLPLMPQKKTTNNKKKPNFGVANWVHMSRGIERVVGRKTHHSSMKHKNILLPAETIFFYTLKCSLWQRLICSEMISPHPNLAQIPTYFILSLQQKGGQCVHQDWDHILFLPIRFSWVPIRFKSRLIPVADSFLNT